MYPLTSFFQKYSFMLALGIIITAYLFFGLQHIDQFITADEHYWVEERVPQYWQAIADHHFTKTFINDKPGVSLALITGPSFFFHPEAVEHCEEKEDKTIQCKGISRTSSLYADFRIPILFFNGALLILLFVLISQITTRFVALLTTFFTALSPILLGISQIINPDALLWSCGSIGIFSFFAYLEKHQCRYIIITALATGFALLSKYSAIILIPGYTLFAMLFFLVRETSDNTTTQQSLLASARSILITTFGAISILCFFLPALVLNSKYINLFLATIPHKGILTAIATGTLVLFVVDTFLLKNILFFKARNLATHLTLPRIIPLTLFLLLATAAISRILFPEWDIFSKIPFDMKNFENARYYNVTLNSMKMLLLEWQSILFSLSPTVLVGTAVFLLLPSRNSRERFFSLSLPFFIMAYIFLFLVSDILLTPRYSILLYPLFSFLAALGFAHITENLKQHSLIRVIFLLFIFIASIASLLSIKPYYLNYANALLPQGSLISDSWGYGGYEAAEYLNHLPDADKMTVWSDYYGICEFFVGKCLTAYTFDKEMIHPDYYVLTRRGKIRYMSRYDRWEEKSGLTAYKYYDISNPVWELFIGGRPENFVKVVRVND